MIRQIYRRSTVLIPTVLFLGVTCLIFTGCEKKNPGDGIYIMHQNRYVKLKSFPLQVKVQDMEGGFVRTYMLENEDLTGAKTFYGRKQRFLINSPLKDFKIVRVNRKTIIKYKYYRFKSYVNFFEIKTDTTDISITGGHLFMEADLDPGRYVLIPWKKYSPIELISYGFIIQSSPT
jgi:hypothetical protein